MSQSIYEISHLIYKDEKHIPHEIEEMYTEKYGVEPTSKHFSIIKRLLKKW